MSDYQKILQVLKELDIPVYKQEDSNCKVINFVDCSLNKVNLMFDKDGNIDFPKENELV